MAKKTLMEFDFKPVESKQFEKEINQKIKEFDDLLASLSAKHKKKIFLWRECFINAQEDRRNSFIMFNDLYLGIHGGGNDQHILASNSLKIYVERMSKANDQLIKLSEMVDAAISSDYEEMNADEMDEDDMYEEILAANQNKNKK